MSDILAQIQDTLIFKKRDLEMDLWKPAFENTNMTYACTDSIQNMKSGIALQSGKNVYFWKK